MSVHAQQPRATLQITQQPYHYIFAERQIKFSKTRIRKWRILRCQFPEAIGSCQVRACVNASQCPREANRDRDGEKKNCGRTKSEMGEPEAS